MNLLLAQEAVVPRNKVENYLLHLGHPDGGGKAKFFLLFGFRREGWSVLEDALLRHAREHPVAESLSDSDGVTYLVEGPLETPFGRKPRIRTVWRGKFTNRCKSLICETGETGDPPSNITTTGLGCRFAISSNFISGRCTLIPRVSPTDEKCQRMG